MTNLYSTIIRHLVHDNQTFPSFLYEQSIVTVNDHILRSLQWKGTTPRWRWWCTATVECSWCDCPTQQGEQGWRTRRRETAEVYRECMFVWLNTCEDKAPGNEGTGSWEVWGSDPRSQVIVTIPCYLPALPVVLLMNLLKYLLQSQTSTRQLLWKRRENHREPVSWGHMWRQRQQIGEPF